jgi:predicted nucleic acid-binding protein
MSDPELTPDFLDTNIFVYAYDPTDRNKQSVAQDLVKKALAGDHLTSVQVLAEFAATLLHKTPHAARPAEVAAVLDALSPIPLVAPDAHMVRRAVEARPGTEFIPTME